jgi:hypothetical protein
MSKRHYELIVRSRFHHGLCAVGDYLYPGPACNTELLHHAGEVSFEPLFDKTQGLLSVA